jgi:hypothetical protein
LLLLLVATYGKVVIAEVAETEKKKALNRFASDNEK